jgi:pyruvate,water dikinase
MGNRRFMDPHEATTIPGTEGWEEMYPYYFRFNKNNPAQESYEDQLLWFHESVHVPTPQHPLDLYTHDMWRLTFAQSHNKIFLVPPARGMDQRVLNGYIYIAPIPVFDPEEVQKRAQIFEQRAGYYYEHWDEFYPRCIERLDKVVADMESVRFVDLPEIESDEMIKENRGYGESYNLVQEHEKLWQTIRLSWQYHFDLLNLTYTADAVYFQVVKTLFPGITDKAIGLTVAGFDTKLFRPTEELQKLAKTALDLGVADAVQGNAHFETLESALKGSEAGKKWLVLFESVRYPWFEMSTGTGWYHTDPSWNMHLEAPLAIIRRYIAQIKAGQQIARNPKALHEQRDRVTSEYRSLIKNEADLQVFDRLLGTARKVAPFAEDHHWYCSNLERSIFCRKMRELAQIFVKHSVFEDTEDIFFLNRYEVPQALHDLCTAWALGVPSPSFYWPDKIKRRKEVFERFKEWDPPPALGPAPDEINDPFAIVMWGVTTERLNDWLKVEETTKEEITELKGFAGSGGVAEGSARLCYTGDDIASLQIGEILVSKITTPTWAPVFSSIGGCVTDIGGIFSHAAIVCREFQLPAVVGTGYATKLIKTGDRIRVDGDTGVVTILEKAK